ncbi:hypothetical protein BDR05DRAFT_398242 [Suillus weaverae]|nr:hypothetical protein BDR05DRAFT_398242 [Suillus weaverae]
MMTPRTLCSYSRDVSVSPCLPLHPFGLELTLAIYARKSLLAFNYSYRPYSRSICDRLNLESGWTMGWTIVISSLLVTPLV